MIVYYSILAGLLYLGILKKISGKYEKAEYILIAAAAIILLFFAAMRSIDIGADTRQYCSHFMKLSQTQWRDLSEYSNGYWGDIETGYKIYNKLLSVFKNQQTITIANSILQIGLISVVIIRQSKNKWLSFFLYYAFCFYQTALNLTPSSFVSYFLFLSFPLIKDQKLVEFLMFVGIGMLFHTSAIFFIPLYFLSKIKITQKRIVIFLLIGVVSAVFYTSILPIIIRIVPSKYAFYIDSSKEHKQLLVELLVYAVQLLAIIFCLLLMKKEERLIFIHDNPVMCWTFLFETVLYMLAAQSSMFSRGAFLFSPYTIIIIPKLLENIKSQNKKMFGTVCIVIYGILIYLARVHVNNVGTTMPYEFFWQV